MAYPYVPMQTSVQDRYKSADALRSGTLFPGLQLPFQAAMKAKMPQIRPELAELMALDFAVDELGLYLTTHSDDSEAFELYKSYIRLAREGREKYQKQYGPILQTDITADSFTWLRDPWPWESTRETDGGTK